MSQPVSCRAVVFTTQTVISAEDLLSNYKKSRLDHRCTNLEEVERLVLEEFDWDFQEILGASRVLRPHGENDGGKVTANGGESRRRSLAGEDYWVPSEISRGLIDACTPEPEQPDFSMVDTLPISPIIPKQKAGNCNGAVPLLDHAQLSSNSAEAAVSLASQHRPEFPVLRATPLPTVNPQSRKHPMVRHKSTSRVVDYTHCTDAAVKDPRNSLSPLNHNKETLRRKSSKALGKSPVRAKSVKRRVVLPPLAINGASDILGAYGSGLNTNVRRKSLLRLRVLEGL